MSVSKRSQTSLPIQTLIGRPSSGQRLALGLSNEQIDIWEHASLLYHGYEWQAAVDTFSILAQYVDDPEESALCLFNSGLIQARLGDFVAAAATLAEASRVDQGLLVTVFLIALVSYELGDPSKAEGCVEVCMDGLRGIAVDYSELGLGFVLDGELLLHNLREIRRAQFSAGSSPASPSHVYTSLLGTPAECIFEAPARPEVKVATPGEEHRHRTPKKLRKLFQSKKRQSLGSLPSERGGSATYSPTSPLRHVTTLSPLSSPTSSQQGRLAGIPEDESIDAKSPTCSPTAPTFNSSSPSAPGSGSSRGWSWHRRPSTPYTPRKARGEYGSTRDLARFIRDGGTEPVRILLPKNATGESEPTAELARFINRYEPARESVEDGHEESRTRENRVNDTLRLDRLLGRKNGLAMALISPESDDFSEQSSTGEVPRSWRQTSIQSQYSTASLKSEFDDGKSSSSVAAFYELPAASPELPPSQPSSGSEPSTSMPPAIPVPVRAPEPPPPPLAPAPAPHSSDTTLELLQPAIFQKKPKRPPAPITLPVPTKLPNPPLSPLTPTPEDQDEAPPPPPSSTSSSDSNYHGAPAHERRIIARTHTLKALEGSTAPNIPPSKRYVSKASRDKPLPPDPGGGHSKTSLRFAGSPSAASTNASSQNATTPDTGNTVATLDFFGEVSKPR